MIAWDIVNSLMRIAITIIIVWKLTVFFRMFNMMERIGLGIAGGCSLLTIPVIWEMQRSPYDGWASSLFSMGIFIYFAGRAVRLWRHYSANRSMIMANRFRSER